MQRFPLLGAGRERHAVGTRIVQRVAFEAQLIATAIAAHPQRDALGLGQGWLKRAGLTAHRGKAAAIFQRDLSIKAAMPLFHTKAAVGHAAHHTIVHGVPARLFGIAQSWVGKIEHHHGFPLSLGQ